MHQTIIVIEFKIFGKTENKNYMSTIIKVQNCLKIDKFSICDVYKRYSTLC